MIGLVHDGPTLLGRLPHLTTPEPSKLPVDHLISHDDRCQDQQVDANEGDERYVDIDNLGTGAHLRAGELIDSLILHR